MVEQPQLRVTIGNLILPGAVSLEVDSLGYFSADRFRLEFAIGPATQGVAYFAGLDMQTVFIEIGLKAGGFTPMFTGQVDNVRVDLYRNLATLSGRDLSARLIDAEISETFVNQTSSQIAETIAARRGLTPNVTATTTAVGQYYELDHARSALGVNARATTEWNLLVWLAEMENFSLSVTESVLNFVALAPVSPMLLSPADLMALTVDVATTIPTQTIVTSWNSRNKVVVTHTAGDTTGASTTLVRPNLTTAEAGSFAAAHLSVLSRHGTVLTATMPGEPTLMPNGEIFLTGTNSAFDQVYRIDAIQRSLDWRTGFTQTIRAYAIAN